MSDSHLDIAVLDTNNFFVSSSCVKLFFFLKFTILLPKFLYLNLYFNIYVFYPDNYIPL